tara:strand:- start:1028 stop:1147 length:120 start_codon:yes stop_codon:yes gene_type:complete
MQSILYIDGENFLKKIGEVLLLEGTENVKLNNSIQYILI